MITGIRIRNFKNFSDAYLKVGPFTVVVGANASGKSNIRDVFRFLHGIGRGYTLAEIIGGKYGSGGQREWAQIRGAMNEVVRFGQARFELDVDFEVAGKPGSYQIAVLKTPEPSSRFIVVAERLTGSFQTVQDPLKGLTVGSPDLSLSMERLTVRADEPVISQVAISGFLIDGARQRAREVLDLFAGIRFLDVVPDSLRKPSFPGQVVLGDAGDNLPTVLQSMCADEAKKSAMLEWIRELTPMDVTDLEFPTDPLTGHVQLALRESNGNVVSAYSASDGTLRFLAMLASLLGDQPARLYFFEELDNGIHPTRLRLLLDLIERQTAHGKRQVVTTTHSPDLLAMVSDSTFASTSLVFRPPGADAAIIARVADLPDAQRLRASQGLGRLHASGWMEDALYFADDPDPVAPA
jgi:predicted ATPase